MCGIVGYLGKQKIDHVLIEGLRRLEYRGYDSAGLALMNGAGIDVRKVAGRVAVLAELVEAQPVRARLGIGHTRWATHGPPTTQNAHPHLDRSGDIAVVHNGIIENADTLRARLEAAGHVIPTPTDTEVLAHLIGAMAGDRLEDKVIEALSHVEGTYGIAVISATDPEKIVVARKGSPVLLGVGEDDELLVASDPSAILAHTRSVVYLKDGDVAVLGPEGYRILDLDGAAQVRQRSDIDWELEAIELGGYPHFMLKEIFEQPNSVTNTLRGRLMVEDGTARLDGLNLDPDLLGAGEIDRIVILGCGTSWHAGLVGRSILERLTRVPVQVEYASEFRYQEQIDLDRALVVAISQSGETADTLGAMRTARSAGARVVSLVNVVGSTIARESDGGIYLHAGPEIGVASTKAFTSQVVALLLLGLYLGRDHCMGEDERRLLGEEMARLPKLLEETLLLNEQVEQIAKEYAGSRNFLYLGRGVSFPVALEGALKLKEVSYIHAEGYPAAEMKHGPIALIDEQMPVVFVAPCDSVYRKVLSNIQEVRARGGRTIVITSEGCELGGLADHEIRIPQSSALISPLLTVVPLQLLAYHVAVLRGCDVDRPRNLAKSVTVE